MSREHVMVVMEYGNYLSPYHYMILNTLKMVLEMREIAKAKIANSVFDKSKFEKLFSDYKYKLYIKWYKESKMDSFNTYKRLENNHIGLDEYYEMCLENDYLKVAQDLEDGAFVYDMDAFDEDCEANTHGRTLNM